MKASSGYLIERTSAEDLQTTLQIQAQTLGRISRSSTESLKRRPSFRIAAEYLKLRYQAGCSNQPQQLFQTQTINNNRKFDLWIKVKIQYMELNRDSSMIKLLFHEPVHA